MGGLSNIRSSRNPEDGSLISSLPAAATGKRKWTKLLPVLIAVAVLVEIAFLGRLETAKNAAATVDSWAGSFRNRSGSKRGAPVLVGRNGVVLRSESCEEWLEREDAVDYSRDFDEVPIFIAPAREDSKTCPVGCKFGHDSSRTTPDAIIGTPNDPSGAISVHRSMESAQYYPQNDVSKARRKGYHVVMTTSLSSDVPVGYFSWAEYDIMAPMERKTEKALAAAFISNCGARNFRLQVLEPSITRNCRTV